MSKTSTGTARRASRHSRVRRKIEGTSERPRMAVFRSLQHVYVQVIDDLKSETLASASSLENSIRSQKHGSKVKTEVSREVGTLIAIRAKEKGINTVVFDRGGHKFHGRVKALADAAREGGLAF